MEQETMGERLQTVLLVDDDPAVRASLSLLLKTAGYHPIPAEDPAAARALLAREPVELMMLDMNFSRKTSGEEGLEFLCETRSRQPRLPVILMTAWGSIDLAVSGMKCGACDFISKPWSNDHLLRAIATALQLSGQEDNVSASRASLDRDHDFGNIIGISPALVHCLETVARVCRTDASVLITGDSGTGKELIAEAIHNNSTRSAHPFVKVNMGGVAASLFESEMFGHVKGAFTDAHRDRQGRFEAADGGTIFLDEIGEIDLNGQVKLLRVLQERKFEVLGSSKTREVDVRVVCATNRDLESMVRAGLFREDLFYRINLITIRLPALRERREDIPLLVRYYMDNLRVLYDRGSLDVSARAMDWLCELPWPGNIRELKNLVERTILVTAHDQLDLEDFARHYERSRSGSDSDLLPAVGTITLEEMEMSMIRKALDFHEGNVSRAARSLGLTRSSLYRRMEKFGMVE